MHKLKTKGLYSNLDLSVNMRSKILSHFIPNNFNHGDIAYFSP